MIDCVQKSATALIGGGFLFMSKINNKNRQQFLLSFFNDNGYEEKQVNSFWLIKQWNGNTKDWQVAIFTNESFRRYKEFTDKNKQLDWLKINNQTNL